MFASQALLRSSEMHAAWRVSSRDSATGNLIHDFISMLIYSSSLAPLSVKIKTVNFLSPEGVFSTLKRRGKIFYRKRKFDVQNAKEVLTVKTTYTRHTLALGTSMTSIFFNIYVL